jgi:hypothetical protein
MNERLRWILIDWPYAYLALGGAGAVIPALLFYMAGAFEPGVHPWYIGSDREFLGMLLMMSLLPAYCGLCVVYGARRTQTLAAIVDASNHTSLKTQTMEVPLRWIIGFALAGAFYAVVFNVPDYGLTFFEDDLVAKSMILAQIMIWCLVMGALSFRFHIARSFHQASMQVQVDIFEPSSLKPFAQTGLIDVLIIAGAMIISTFQSLDFTFRPDNYMNALALAIPSMLFLVIYPMWGIHRRMKEDRQSQLNELNQLIESAPRSLHEADMHRLEVLLQRRERVKAAHSWPLDIGIVQRFLFYVIIPPLAWVGAALMEAVIDNLIQ